MQFKDLELNQTFILEENGELLEKMGFKVAGRYNPPYSTVEVDEEQEIIRVRL